MDTYWTRQGCTYSTHRLHSVICLRWLQVLGQCMAVGTNSFPPSWTMYDCMYSMATFWTLCSCKYSGQGSIWVQVFIGHNLHDATCKYIDSRLLNGAHTLDLPGYRYSKYSKQQKPERVQCADQAEADYSPLHALVRQLHRSRQELNKTKQKTTEKTKARPLTKTRPSLVNTYLVNAVTTCWQE